MKRDIISKIKRQYKRYFHDLKTLKSIPECKDFYKWAIKYPLPSIKRYTMYTDFIIGKYKTLLINTNREIAPLHENLKVYTFWYQKIDNAPQIVKDCLAINKEILNKKNIEFVILDKNNLKDFIELPEFIYTLVEQNYVDLIQLSNFVRLKVLLEYGGLWVDATVLLPENFSFDEFKDQTTSSLNLNDKNFTYSKNNLTVVNPVIASYIAFNKGNSEWKCIYDTLVEYYKEYKKEFNYYIIDIIITAYLILNQGSQINNDKICQGSFFELLDTFNYEKTYEIPQKLSYKINAKETKQLEFALDQIKQKILPSTYIVQEKSSEK